MRKIRISVRLEEYDIMRLKELANIIQSTPSETVRSLLKMNLDAVTDGEGYIKQEMAEAIANMISSNNRGRHKNNDDDDEQLY